MTDQLHAAPERDASAGTNQQPAWVPPPMPSGAQPDAPAWPNQPWPQQQPYGPYSYAPPAAPPQKSRFGIGFLVGFAVGFAVAVAGLLLLGALAMVDAPANLGDSQRGDTLYALCDEGDMGACDLLYLESAVGSELEEFGATCGGRVTTWQSGNCVTAGIERE